MSDAKLVAELQRAAHTLQSGAVGEARAQLAALAERHPSNADALNLLGIALSRDGDDVGAAAALGRAAELNPQHPGAHLNRGNVLRKLRRLDDAAASFRRAIALKADAVVPYRQLGITLNELGRHGEAVDVLNRAASLQPNYGPIYLERARAARGLGNNPAALYDVEQALRLDPGNVDALIVSSAVKREMGRRDEALRDCDRALALDPGNWSLHNNRGVLLDELQRQEEALASFERSLQLNPNNPDTFLNIGTALVGLKRGEEALRKYDETLALDPSDIAALNAKGVVYLAMRRFEEALANFDLAAAREPTSVVSNFYRAFALLAMGHYREGFAAYEWRRRGAQQAALPRFEQPELKPGEDVRGKRLLLHGEQGLGDILQFARFARSFADRGATVLVAAYLPLKRLLASLGRDIFIVDPERPAPEFDVVCPLLSAAHVLDLTLESIPAEPYLKARPELIAQWRERLKRTEGTLRVGLAWSGNAQYVNDASRSLSFDSIRSLLDVPGVTFVSLQRDVRQSDEIAFAMANVLDMRDGLGDLADTAALISELDLVISVDTSIGHLTGALGKPVWILLSAVADWRWLDGRDDSPWYPTARLFRQKAIGEWGPVLTEVKTALARLAQ